MAYSPAPRTASLSRAALSQSKHRSPSPLSQQPISKREKKRFNMEDRLAQITNDFTRDRDIHYRKQLQAFQLDIDYIRRANPYAETPLDDIGGDSSEDFTNSATASSSGKLGGQTYMNGNGVSGRIGPNAAKFAQEINDTMEQRDADLTTVAYNHNSRIDNILKDNDFYVSVAHQEHQLLAESLRRRLILNLNQKKAAMQKEKEKFDIADTHAGLLHPNHFSLNSVASPGGPQSNRKTRHTRHRLEVDDIDTTNGNNKRKRKAPGDNDNGSPAPAGRDLEPASIFREASAKLEYHQVTAPLYTIDRLFSQKELDQNLQTATFSVIENLKRRRLNKGRTASAPSLVNTNLDASDSEENPGADPDVGMDGANDDAFLTAPDMERTATNTSQHATRSNRAIVMGKGIAAGDATGSLAGRAIGARLIGTYDKKERKREEEYARAPPLSDQEVEEELALIKVAMEDEAAGRLNNDDMMEEVAGHREDHIGTISVVGTVSVNGQKTAEEVDE